MKFRSLLVCVLLAAPAIAPGANKEIQELQRDIGLLQQQIKDLQKTQDEKFGAALELARQSLEAANRANAGIAAVTAEIGRTLKPLQDSLAAPLAGINSRLNQTSDDVRALQQSVGELAGTVAGVQSKLDDIKRLVQTMQQPAAPPPSDVAPAPGAATKPQASGPSMPAGDLYNSALSDYRSARYPLAQQGFEELLKFYSTDKLAPNAQFYIGMIHYTARNYDQAANDFDAVLEHYTKNFKTEEAMLYKGRSLVLVGKRDDGVKEFRQLLRDDAKSDQAKQACDELKNLGLGCTTGGAAPNRGSIPKRGKK